ncbi:MAG: T9SS type A sorting domain-containing protein [Bacteroidota bacterium]
MYLYQHLTGVPTLWNAFFISLLFCFTSHLVNAQVSAGQIDDFNDGTFQSWAQGAGSQGLANVANQLEITADGAGQNGRIVAFNSNQWSGDYLTAGVERISIKLNNTSASTTLNVRLSFGSQQSANNGTWFTTTDVATIAAGSGQQEATFSLAAADMTFVRGTNDYNALFSNVAFVRIINSSAANSNQGDFVVATLLVDDITALTNNTSAPYDETTDGDISDDRFAPTAISVAEGSNTISGCVQGNSQPGGRDIDYFTFEVPAGSELTAINLDNYDADPGNLAFIGIQAGTTFTEPPSGTNVANLLGGLTYGESDESTDILPAMGNLSGAMGFTPPLPAGNYTIWMNQTGPPSCYTLDLVIANTSSTAYDEATDGDISNDRLTPTVISVADGSNTVSGCVQGNSQPGGRDIDYFTFEVLAGSELIAINLDDYDADPGNLAFIGIQAGTTFTEPPSGTNVANLLGGLTYGENNEGTDILPAMGNLGGAIGFIPPLPAGSYTIWMNQTGPSSCYTLDLVISPIDDNCFNTRTFTNTLYPTIGSGTYSAANTITTAGIVAIAANANVVFEAGQSITLTEGFTASSANGSTFTARIAACTVSANKPVIEDRTVEVKTKMPSMTVYPNPTQSQTVISYELPAQQTVNINVFSFDGMKVKTLAQGLLQDSGIHNISLMLDNWSTGMYFVVLQTEQQQLVQRLSVVK